MDATSKPPAKRKRCLAKTRGGTPCQRTPVPGSRRCRFHGGESTGPKGGSGFWATIFTDDELAEAQRYSGTLDHELLIARCRLRRVHEREQAFRESQLPVESVEVSGKPGPDGELSADGKTGWATVRRRRPDFDAKVDALLARIGYLEERRDRLQELPKLRAELEAILGRFADARHVLDTRRGAAGKAGVAPKAG